MKRAILILMVLVPSVMMAQETGSSLAGNTPSSAGSSLKGIILTRNFGSVPLAPYDSSNLAFALGQGSDSQAKQKSASTQASKSGGAVERPRTEGSMVGYIDDPIVGSQVRIRFDAGFNDSTPDMAEFFYAKCGCYRGLANVAPAAFDPNAAGPPPGSGIVIPRTLNFQQLYLKLEYAPITRFSVFVEAPFRWLQADGLVAGTPGSFPNQGGFSDLRFGFKAAALASSSQYLTFQLQFYAPTGEASKGLGTNHWSIEPAVLYYQSLSKRASLESEFGLWHPTGGSEGVPGTGSQSFWGNVLFYGIGPSYTLYSTDRVRFTPVLELVGWHVLSGEVTGPANPDASGTNIVNLKVGARTSWGDHHSFYAGFGHKLTTADWYQDIVRVEYRYSF
jgi:Putative MetA-pathway of phenol degradation